MIRSTSVHGLSFIPGGQWDSRASQALAQEKVRSVLEQLRKQYDFIILDSSPVLPVTDALMLGQHVDGVMLSVLRDVSRAPQIQAAYQRLARLGIRTLGAVVLGVPADKTSVGQPYPGRFWQGGGTDSAVGQDSNLVATGMAESLSGLQRSLWSFRKQAAGLIPVLRSMVGR